MERFRSKDLDKLKKLAINPKNIVFHDESSSSASSGMVKPASRSLASSHQPPKAIHATRSGDTSSFDPLPEGLLDEAEESDGDEMRQQQEQRQQNPPKLPEGAELEELLTRVLKDEQGQPTSLGSSGHHDNECKACLFMHTKTGCHNGILCEFCHFWHKRCRRKNKLRPCKGKRDRYRKVVTRMEQAIEDNPDALDDEVDRLPPSIATNELLKTKLLSKMHLHAEHVRQRDGYSSAPRGTGDNTIVSL